MASTPFDASLGLESIRALVFSINEYILELLGTLESWSSLKIQCSSRLNIQQHNFFELSDFSILSNLYWGIEGIEAAILAKCPEEKTTHLMNSERLLQVPAFLDEYGVTAGIQNDYLVCSSYFFLSVVKKLQNDDWQAAMHFVQAISVSPRIVKTELAPRLWTSLFHNISEIEVMNGERSLEVIRQIAKRYKHWLMYYQVMSYGENPQWHNRSRESSSLSLDDELQHVLHAVTSSSEASKSGEMLQHPVNCIIDNAADKYEVCREFNETPKRCTSIKRLWEELMESQSDTDDSDSSMETASACDCQPDSSTSDFDSSFRRSSHPFKGQVINQAGITTPQNYRFNQLDHQGRAKKPLANSERDSKSDLMVLNFLDGLAKCEEEYAIEVTTFYEMLNSKKGVKYAMLKDLILDQLLTAISTSNQQKVIKASVSILTKIISLNKSAVEDIKKKGLQLCDLATALKHNVHEAVVLIYLINPSPTEIKTLELLPSLVEVVCTSNSYKGKPELPLITPPAASLMIIEALITAFDCATNTMHLAAISSPHILCGLLDVARSNNNLEEYISLATVLIKCIQFDRECRRFISEFVPMVPFICLLQSNQIHAKCKALEFFHEILHLPRSSAITLLKQIQKEGNTDIMKILMHCIEEQFQPDCQLLAANLLLQLETLENTSGKSVVMEEAMHIIIKSLTSEESSTQQLSAALILANIGGTHAWTAEPYTVPWLVKKAGFTSLYHRHMIKNIDWLDQCLQDPAIEFWCSKIAKGIIGMGKAVFHALEKGLRSRIKTVRRDSLTAIAWIGTEIAKYPDSLRYSACDILLNGIEQFLHPGLELEERLLACLCIYNFASGRGMQRLVNLSEGVRESLRRFSSVTWMAEELHRVADYYVPNKSRISCVHTQILEANHSSSGAVTALIYYRGLLLGGYSDGSIKIWDWDMKQQSMKLVCDVKDHKKAVTCFALYEAGESLLSGSADRTIRVWQMVQTKLECIEVIAMEEAIKKLETHGQMIFAITQSHGMKVSDSSRRIKDICRTKKVKCMNAVQGKVYIGCMDSSIQELSIVNSKEKEMKAPTKCWILQNKPINSIVVYKDWLYAASSNVEGSKIKEWRTQCKPQMSMVPEKGGNVMAMGVVEDFIYLNCSSSTSTIQIWLRGTLQKVGRISAGSRITSILTANDIILCGTDKGLIKGWIPL